MELGSEETVEFSLLAEIDESELLLTLPEAERSSPSITALAVISGVQSRMRRAVELDKDGVGRWTGKLHLPKSEHLGEILIHPMIVRDEDQGDVNFAQHAGDRLATGDPLFVNFDERPLQVSDHISIRWVDFASSPNSTLSSSVCRDQLHHVTTDEGVPVIWLNEGVPDLKRILSSEARRGMIVRVREAAFSMITAQSWGTLAAAAISNLMVALMDDSDPVEAFSGLPEWMKQVLAVIVFETSNAPEETKIREFAQSLSTQPGSVELIGAIQSVIQDLAQSRKAFDGLVRMETGEGV